MPLKLQQKTIKKLAKSAFWAHTGEFYEKAVQGYNEVAQLERADYRCNWFLGTFYACALQPFESIKQFDFIFEQVPDKKINPACIAECAYAESLAFMKKWAIADFIDYHKKSGTKAEENILLQDLKKNFIDYKSFIIFAVALVLFLKWKVNAIWLTVGAAIAGILIY